MQKSDKYFTWYYRHMQHFSAIKKKRLCFNSKNQRIMSKEFETEFEIFKIIQLVNTFFMWH